MFAVFSSVSPLRTRLFPVSALVLFGLLALFLTAPSPAQAQGQWKPNWVACDDSGTPLWAGMTDPDGFVYMSGTLSGNVSGAQSDPNYGFLYGSETLPCYPGAGAQSQPYDPLADDPLPGLGLEARNGVSYDDNGTPASVTSSVNGTVNVSLHACFLWQPVWQGGGSPASPPPPAPATATFLLQTQLWTQGYCGYYCGYQPPGLLLPLSGLSVQASAADDVFGEQTELTLPIPSSLDWNGSGYWVHGSASAGGSHLVTAGVSGAGIYVITLSGTTQGGSVDVLDGSRYHGTAYAEAAVNGCVTVPDVSLSPTVSRPITSTTDSLGNQISDAYAMLDWKIKEDDSPSDYFYDGYGTYVATATVNGSNIYNPQTYNWHVDGTPFAQCTATESDPNPYNNPDYLLPDVSKPFKYFYMDLGTDPTLLPQTTKVDAAVTGPNTTDSVIAVGTATVTWHLPWENATPDNVPAITRNQNDIVTLSGGSTKYAQDVQPGDLISKDNTPPSDPSQAWQVIFVFRVDAGPYQSYVIYLNRPLPAEQDAEQALIDGQIAQYHQAVSDTLAVGKAGVEFGLEGYVQLAEAYASGPFYEQSAEQLLAAGYKAADVLQRVSLARADAARLQAASGLAATLIANIKAKQVAGTLTPQEAAQVEAELPQLERGQKDLQVGIDHLQSYADQAEQVATNAQDDVQVAKDSVAVDVPVGVVKGNRLPVSEGTWSDPSAPGECDWHSTRTDVNEATGNKPIPFKNCFPDFSQWEYVDEEDGIAGEVTISNMTSYTADFKEADSNYAVAKGWFKTDGSPDIGRVIKLRKEKGLTWHHHEDGHTMQLVPKAINGKIPHQGGNSLS